MSPSEPAPAVAAGYLADDARMAAAVRAASLRFVGWLTAAYLLATAGISGSFLSGVGLTSAGFDRRWVRALVAWGALFAAVLVVGLLAFRGQPASWLPASLVCAVPLVLGARAELRA